MGFSDQEAVPLQDAVNEREPAFTVLSGAKRVEGGGEKISGREKEWGSSL